MNQFINFLAVTLLGFCVVGIGCDRPAHKGASRPDIKVMSWKPNLNLIENNSVEIDARNVGASGDVTFTFTQDGRSWNKTAYFDSGEQRIVTFSIPGSKLRIENGQYQGCSISANPD